MGSCVFNSSLKSVRLQSVDASRYIYDFRPTCETLESNFMFVWMYIKYFYEKFILYWFFNIIKKIETNYVDIV